MGNCEQANGVVSPVSVNFDHACQSFFVRAEDNASITAKCAFFAEFRFVGLTFEPDRHAEFASRLPRERSLRRHSIVANAPKPKRRLFAARACFHKVFFGTRPRQAPRNGFEFTERAE